MSDKSSFRGSFENLRANNWGTGGVLVVFRVCWNHRAADAPSGADLITPSNKVHQSWLWILASGPNWLHTGTGHSELPCWRCLLLAHCACLVGYHCCVPRDVQTPSADWKTPSSYLPSLGAAGWPGVDPSFCLVEHVLFAFWEAHQLLSRTLRCHWNSEVERTVLRCWIWSWPVSEAWTL